MTSAQRTGTLPKLIASIISLHGLTCMVTKDDSMSNLMSAINQESDASKTSSRNYGTYGNSADSSNQYYSTYTGYPSYGVQSSTYSQYSSPNYYLYDQIPEKKKPSQPLPPAPTYPTPYYIPGHETFECTEVMMGGVVSDVLNNAGINGFGILRPVVAAFTAAILTKIPIILAVKALLVKLILMPLGFIILSLPVILPIVLLFFPWWSKIKETFIGTTTSAPSPMMVMVPAAGNNTVGSGAKARAIDYGQDVFTAMMESEKCFEKLACSLGSRDADTPFIQPVSWLLKFLQSFKFVQRNIQIRSALKRYRDAYLKGVDATVEFINETNSTTSDTEKFCSEQLFPCSTSNLYLKPELRSFSKFLS